MEARGRLAWIPAFLLGFVAATGGELAGGLLLYQGEGFLRALTLLLAVELGGLGAGLWTGTRMPASQDGLRRRWLFCLVFYAGAAGFAAAWQMAGELTSSFFGQGLGLALLAGLPLYGVGSALGGLVRPPVRRSIPGTVEEAGGWGGVGAPAGALAALGGSVGVLTTGLLLFRWLQPVSILLLCVVLVSSSALLHGWILDAGTPDPDDDGSASGASPDPAGFRGRPAEPGGNRGWRGEP